MSQMKYTLLLALMALSFLSVVRIELLLHPVDAADVDDVDKDTAEDEQTPVPSSPYLQLQGITKRRIDLPVLLFVTRHPIPHTPGHAFGRFCHSSAAIVYRDVLFYQALQVYRF